MTLSFLIGFANTTFGCQHHNWQRVNRIGETKTEVQETQEVLGKTTKFFDGRVRYAIFREKARFRAAKNAHKAKFEQELRQELKWKHLSAVPDCPVASFCDLLKEVRAGSFLVSVDYIAANRLALMPSSPLFSSASAIISWVPYLVAVACLPAAYLVGDGWIVAGVPLSLIAMYISTPVNPIRRYITLIGIIAVAGALWFGSHSTMTPAILCVSYAVSFSAIRFLNFLNLRRLARAALGSEPIFLWLLENRNSYILNTFTDEAFWIGREE